MEKLLQLKDKAMIGTAVQDFTAVEDCLKNVGAHMDELVSCDDAPSTLSTVSNIYLCLTSLKQAVNNFIEDSVTYIDDCRVQDSTKE